VIKETSRSDLDPIPKFRRKRQVTINGDGRLSCTCNNFEITGFPCSHIASVLKKNVPDWTGFTKFDVCIAWHNCYIAMHTSDTFFADLIHVSKNDIRGPLWPRNSRVNPSSIPIENIENFQCDEQCFNYTNEQIRQAMTSVNLFGFTQVTQNEQATQNEYVSDDVSDDDDDNEPPDFNVNYLLDDDRIDGKMESYQVLKGYFGDLCSNIDLLQDQEKKLTIEKVKEFFRNERATIRTKHTAFNSTGGIISTNAARKKKRKRMTIKK
jgi:hypothetical protein